MADTIRFGPVLKERRNRLRLSQQALAELMDVSRNTVINWEVDRSKPEYDVLPRLCAVLDLSLGELFGSDYPEHADEQERRLLNSFRQLSPVGKRTAERVLSVMLDEELRNRDEELAVSFRLFAEYYSPVAAGSGCEFGDRRPGPVFLRKNGRNDRADAVIRVSGDSMEPVYHDGDLLYFRYEDDAPPGSDAVCSTVRGAIVKRVDADGSLCSVNPARPFDMKTEGDSVRVLGIITGAVEPADRPEPQDLGLLREIFHDELKSFRDQYLLDEWD